MFSSINNSPDYAASQSENRFFNINNLKDLSNSFGSVGVKELDKSNVSAGEDNQDENNLVKLKNKTSTTKDNSALTDVKDSQTTDLIINKTSKDTVVIHLLGQGGDEGTTLKDDKAPVTSSFDVLAAEVGAVGGKISKIQLMSYLQSLTSSNSASTADMQAIAFVKNLIAQFDNLSNGADYITSFNGIKEPQDYKTITKEQVTSPVDVRV